MIRKMSLLIIVTLFLAPTWARAQIEDQGIRNITFDTLVRGQVEQIPVGVDQMKYIGNQYITPDDSSIMQWATNVIKRDIDFYADFELIQIDTFYLRVYEITELDMLGWKRLGADRLVKLEAEFPGNKLRIWWRLYDVVHQQQIAKGKVEYHRAYWRELAHDVSNEIVYWLTGDPGIFRTKIAYVKALKPGVKEIFVSDYDNANEVQLTKTGSINISPTFSPDGREIYFTSYKDGQPWIYKVGVDGGRIEKVAGYPGINAAPAVSPDGLKLACVLSKDGNSEIYVLDTTGRVIKRLTNNRWIDSAPSWSPDGTRIAFSSDRTGTPQLYTMDDDGLNIQRLTFRGGYNDSPFWSPRGSPIVFVSRSRTGRFDIAAVDTAGHEYRMLTNIGANENPHYSPDGKHLIFSSTRLGGRDLYTMDASGRDQRRLTQTSNCSNPTWGPLPR